MTLRSNHLGQLAFATCLTASSLFSSAGWCEENDPFGSGCSVDRPCELSGELRQIRSVVGRGFELKAPFFEGLICVIFDDAIEGAATNLVDSDVAISGFFEFAPEFESCLTYQHRGETLFCGYCNETPFIAKDIQSATASPALTLDVDDLELLEFPFGDNPSSPQSKD